MKLNPFNKVTTFRTGKEIIDLLVSKEHRSSQQIIDPPVTETEVTLHHIWKDVLGHNDFGIHDDFFQLGGNSLKCVQLVSRISRQLSSDVQLTDVYTQPTIAQIAALIPSRKNELSSFLPIPLHSSSARLPLSFNQERLWFIDRLEGSVHYHLPLVFRLQGRVGKEALQQALRHIVQRHEVLRTVIGEEEGEACQLVKTIDEWQLTLVDGTFYQHHPDKLRQQIDTLIDQPFDLSKDYMLRAVLISLDEQEHVLVITLHHIASDGWSVEVLTRELTAFYSAYTTNRPVKLPPLPIQYADYALWQRQHLQGEVLDKKLNYWKQKLEGVVPLQLPTDFVRPAVQGTKGATQWFTIDKKIAEDLQRLSQQQNTTLFMTLLAAFKVLLYRYSGQQDICVGSAIANRTREEVENLIGFFVNTLALRSEVKGEHTFIELLQQVRATTLEAYEHQDVPFEKVVEVVVKERDTSRNPLFQVMLVFEDAVHFQELDLGTVKLYQQQIGLNRTKFDITVAFTQTSQGLQGAVEYSTELYTAATIDRMVGHFQQLLSSIVKQPQQSIDTLPLLTEREEQQLLYEFNQTAVDYPKDKSIVDLFEEQVIKTPHNIAVVFEGQELTYHELNARANQLAYYLKSKGVGAEMSVPICMQRSVEMIIGILGILKAGAAYVPIDPEYPEERIAYILEDTGATLVFSNRANRKKLAVTKEMEVVEIDTHRTEMNQLPVTNPTTKPAPRHLVYVIYTSGSTGKPKGVMIENKSLVNLIQWHNQEYSVMESSITTAAAGVGFDAFGWEIWPYLSAGASIYVINDDVRLDPCNLLALIILNKVTHSFISTAMVQDFVNASRHKITALKYLLTGGDALSSVDINGIGYKIVNNYGPTEYTVVTSNYKITEKEQHTVPPIGKPIANTTIRILNEQQNLVPIGVPGELYVGGAGLARGYINKPELTAGRFIIDPFSQEVEARIYKTGDLARWLPDGNIEYLGRIDNQVKIRGYRIELGEIESVLLQSGLVRQAVVTIHENENTGKQLVAYVVAETFNKQRLISHLQGKLPKFMIPALWIKLEHLPLTPNGKIDKKALPEPDISNFVYNEYVAPRSDIEQTLAGIWKELLCLEQVSIEDNFFELGGHSLLAKRMLSYIERTFFISIPIRIFFQFNTISSMCKYIELQLEMHTKEKNPVGYKTVNI